MHTANRELEKVYYPFEDIVTGSKEGHHPLPIELSLPYDSKMFYFPVDFPEIVYTHLSPMEF